MTEVSHLLFHFSTLNPVEAHRLCRLADTRGALLGALLLTFAAAFERLLEPSSFVSLLALLLVLDADDVRLAEALEVVSSATKLSATAVVVSGRSTLPQMPASKSVSCCSMRSCSLVSALSVLQ